MYNNNISIYNKVRPIRISDEVWDLMREQKKRGMSWNLFLKELIIRDKENG